MIIGMGDGDEGATRGELGGEYKSFSSPVRSMWAIFDGRVEDSGLSRARLRVRVWAEPKGEPCSAMGLTNVDGWCAVWTPFRRMNIFSSVLTDRVIDSGDPEASTVTTGIEFEVF